jgi:type II secretory pathway pseudopilin PulG
MESQEYKEKGRNGQRIHYLECFAGFTLVDVMVGILLSLIFLGVAMQSIVMSTYLRVKSQGDSEATVWIQEDIERIKYEASRLDYDPILSEYKPDPDSCQNTNGKNYADRLKVEVNKIKVPLQTSKKVAGGKNYQIVRTFSNLSSTTPGFSSILRIDYAVKDDQSRVVAESFTEVVPEASFDCPVF